MKVLITGGAGFLGTRLARRLLERGTLQDGEGRARRIDRIVLVDVTAPPAIADARVSAVTGDISDPTLLNAIIDAAGDDELSAELDRLAAETVKRARHGVAATTYAAATDDALARLEAVTELKTAWHPVGA